MPHARRITGIALSLSVSATAALAAAAPDEDLREIIVSARSLEVTTPLELSGYGYDVEFVTAEEIRNGGYVDLPQALEMLVPGAFVAPQSGAFSYIDLSLQGSRGGDVLWTVDGVRLNNRLYHTTAPTDTLPASMVERLEVLKGSHGLMYGTAAVAGVVNVVTRAFSDEPGGAVTLGGHTRGGLHADAWGRGALGRHRFVGWVSKDESDGFSPYTAYQPNATTRDRRYDITSIGLKYGIDLADDLRLSLQGVHTEGKVDFATHTRTDVNERDEDILSARLDYTPGGRVALYLKGYLHDWDTDYYPVGSSSAPDYWGFRDQGASAAVKLNLIPAVEYHLGYEYQRYTGRDDYLSIAPGGEKVHAAFAQVRTTEDFSSRARLAAGLRYNDTGDSDATIWSLSGHFDLTGALYVEGSLGTSFRLPDAEQMLAVEPDYILGNQALKPEESFNINLAIGGSLPSARPLAWQLTGWRRKIENLIQADESNPPEGFTGIWINTEGTVKASGMEALLRGQLTGPLLFEASYMFSRERNPSTGEQLPNRPRHSGKLALSLASDARPWGADLALKYVGSTYSATGAGRVAWGDDVVANLGAHWFPDTDRRHRLGLRVENLFGREYVTRYRSTSLSGGAPGEQLVYGNRGTPRTLHASWTYSF
jgi:outer membrane cobalamin receptor